ncbi:MAG: hypothetical protein KBG19_04350 [Bacteroidales bacterium]|nr:hypothetical protein [Bacteroidales bacterium]
MKNKFSDKLQELWESAQLFIESQIKNGETISFQPDDEENDNWLYDLPSVSTVGKYGNYNEYAIVSIERKVENIILHTRGKGENSENADFVLPEIDYSNICFLADEIYRVKTYQLKPLK